MNFSSKTWKRNEYHERRNICEFDGKVDADRAEVIAREQMLGGDNGFLDLQ